MRRLFWACAVCICPTKRTLGIYGLTYVGALHPYFLFAFLCSRNQKVALDLHPKILQITKKSTINTLDLQKLKLWT